MSNYEMTLSSYNQLLEELMKLFPDDTDNITSILIMEDDIKIQSTELFSELLEDNELFELFKKRKIKVFSSKSEKTKNLSSSLFGSTLTLKNIFNNQTSVIKDTLWTYLQLIVLTILLINKEINVDKINMLEEAIKMNRDKKVEQSDIPVMNPPNVEQSDNPVMNPLDLNVNKDTNNMINDIISNFEARLQNGQGNPLESVMEITEMINNKYQDKINNGEIEIEKLLENVTGSIPGLEQMMKSMGGGPNKPKETVIIDENFSTDDVKIEKPVENAPNMANMMGMFNKLNNMTDKNGNMDIGNFMKQLSKDANMTDGQVKQMEEMVSMVDKMDLSGSLDKDDNLVSSGSLDKDDNLVSSGSLDKDDNLVSSGSLDKDEYSNNYESTD